MNMGDSQQNTNQNKDQSGEIKLTQDAPIADGRIYDWYSGVTQDAVPAGKEFTYEF